MRLNKHDQHKLDEASGRALDARTTRHVLMRVLGFADDSVPCPIAGQWLVEFDHDADDGLGAGTFTDDPALAMRFKNISDALEFWKRTSTVRPRRADGKPNRPLTATTVTFDTYTIEADEGVVTKVEVPTEGDVRDSR